MERVGQIGARVAVWLASALLAGLMAWGATAVYHLAAVRLLTRATEEAGYAPLLGLVFLGAWLLFGTGLWLGSDLWRFWKRAEEERVALTPPAEIPARRRPVGATRSPAPTPPIIPPPTTGARPGNRLLRRRSPMPAPVAAVALAVVTGLTLGVWSPPVAGFARPPAAVAVVYAQEAPQDAPSTNDPPADERPGTWLPDQVLDTVINRLLPGLSAAVGAGLRQWWDTVLAIPDLVVKVPLALLGALLAGTVDQAAPLLGGAGGLLTTTPKAATVDLPLVQTLYEVMSRVAVALMGLLAVLLGLTVMTAPALPSLRLPVVEAQEALPRLMLGPLAILFVRLLLPLLFDLTNGLNQAIGSETLTGPEAFPGFQALLTALRSRDVMGTVNTSAGSGLAFVVYVSLGLFLVPQQVIRLVFLIVLLVAAPLCHAGLVHPMTEGMARRWWLLFLSTLLAQPAQVVVVRAGVEVIRYIGTQSIFSIASLLYPVACLGTLLAALMVPGLMRATLVTSGGQTFLGAATFLLWSIPHQVAARTAGRAVAAGAGGAAASAPARAQRWTPAGAGA